MSVVGCLCVYLRYIWIFLNNMMVVGMSRWEVLFRGSDIDIGCEILAKFGEVRK